MVRDEPPLHQVQEPSVALPAMMFAEAKAGQAAKSEQGSAGGSCEASRAPAEAPPTQAGALKIRVSQTPALQAAAVNERLEDVLLRGLVVVVGVAAFLSLLRPPELVLFLLLTWVLLFCLGFLLAK